MEKDFNKAKRGISFCLGNQRIKISSSSLIILLTQFFTPKFSYNIPEENVQIQRTSS